jgi:hypothetical protein
MSISTFEKDEAMNPEHTEHTEQAITPAQGETAADAATAPTDSLKDGQAAPFELEDFDLDDIEVIESKVFA